MLWVLKEPSQWNSSFDHQKQMLKLMDKKIFKITYTRKFAPKNIAYLDPWPIHGIFFLKK